MGKGGGGAPHFAWAQPPSPDAPGREQKGDESGTHEAVSAGLARLAVRDDHGLLDVAEALEVLAQRRVRGVVGQAAHEDLGERGVLLPRVHGGGGSAGASRASARRPPHAAGTHGQTEGRAESRPGCARMHPPATRGAARQRGFVARPAPPPPRGALWDS